MSEPGPKISIDLVVASVDRTSELERLLGSLSLQTYRSFRVLVVDQNEDERLDAVLARFEGPLSIQRLRSAPGLSRARNVALSRLAADLVAFPDDDCWYPPDLLERVTEQLGVHPEWEGLSVRSTDRDGRPSNMRWDSGAGAIDRRNVWRRAISYSFFLRRNVVDTVGSFAEELGAGSGTAWASGEETDYLLRALAAGFSLWYDPSLTVHHESARAPAGREAIRKGYRSGLGNGRILRAHGYPAWFVAYRVAQLLAGAILFLLKGQAGLSRFYAAMAVGRVRGWLGKPPARP